MQEEKGKAKVTLKKMLAKNFFCKKIHVTRSQLGSKNSVLYTPQEERSGWLMMGRSTGKDCNQHELKRLYLQKSLK